MNGSVDGQAGSATMFNERKTKVFDTAQTKAFYEGGIVALWQKVWAPAEGHLHMAMFDHADMPIHHAMARANEAMAVRLPLDARSEVLEVACGLGATARWLARTFQCRVVATNISQPQIDEAAAAVVRDGLEKRITTGVCDFGELPYDDERFDVWWCQESLVHAEDKHKVLSEAFRVLKPGGYCVLSVLTLRDEVSEPDRIRIYRRIHAPAMWSARQHAEGLDAAGFEYLHGEDWSGHVPATYSWVIGELHKHRAAFDELIGPDAFGEMLADFQLWIDRARSGDIGWSYFLARKPLSGKG